MFPAYFFTTLRITVHHQTVAPECPASGSFRVFFLNDEASAFSDVCQQKLLTLRYDSNSRKPMSRRFSDQRGVDVGIENYGKTESAPFYEPMYKALEGAGYVRDRDIRVAGYDSRLTPDMRSFLSRTKKLIEDTYRDKRQPARSPRRPLERTALRPVPAHAHLAAVEGHVHPRIHPARRELSGPGNPLPALLHGPQRDRLHVADHRSDRAQRRRDDAPGALELHERL
jgi:hypothetical protein